MSLFSSQPCETVPILFAYHRLSQELSGRERLADICPHRFFKLRHSLCTCFVFDFILLFKEILSVESRQLILPLFTIDVLLRRSKVLYLFYLLWRIGFDPWPKFSLCFLWRGDRLFVNWLSQLFFLEKAIYWVDLCVILDFLARACDFGGWNRCVKVDLVLRLSKLWLCIGDLYEHGLE